MNRTDNALLLLAAGGLGLWWLTQSRPKKAFSFADKVVLISGGSRGLGLVLARELTRQGAKVAICARDERELERASHDLTSLGAPPIVAVADVTDASQMELAVSSIYDQVGPIDVLINNAGTIRVGPLSSMTREDFERTLAVNFWGAYNAIEAVLPDMKARKRGRIVNISSIGGKISVPHLAPYCVGKFALVGYSKGLRAELAQDGITVTTICPGLMRTGSPRHAHFKGKTEAEYAWFKISSSVPGLTVSAEQAAREILEATRRGDAEHVISLPAQLATLMEALFPEVTANLISLANQLLPGASESDTDERLGKDCETSAMVDNLSMLTNQAALQNNEIDPMESDPPLPSHSR